MLLIKLFKAKQFSQEERIVLDFLWKAYLEYDGRNASYLYSLMKKDPKDTDYRLDLSNLKVKWVNTIDSGIMGAFNPMFPSTIFICSSSSHEIRESLSGTDAPYRCDRFSEIELDAYWLINCFPTIMHELYHMLQFKTCEVGYVAMRFVSIFTTIPYYLFQNASWMPKFRKWFEWDIEGQAEKYGNLAPNLEQFCAGVEAVEHAYRFRDIQLNSLFRDTACSKEEYVERKAYIDESFKYVNSLYDSSIVKQGKALYDLLIELAKK